MMMPNLLHFRRLLVIISIMSARQIKIFTSRSEMILPRTMGGRRRGRVPLWIVVFIVDFVFTRRKNMFLRLMKCFVVLLVYVVFERNNNVHSLIPPYKESDSSINTHEQLHRYDQQRNDPSRHTRFGSAIPTNERKVMS